MHLRTLLVVTTCALCTEAALSAHFTLSDDALLALDYNQQRYFGMPQKARITSRRDVAGPGVEFDVHFPGLTSSEYSILWTSDKDYGAGTVTGFDVTSYEKFDLTFSVVAVDGSATPPAGGRLQVGAVIGDSSISTLWQFQPRMISFGGSDPVSNTSSTTVSRPVVNRIGFYVWLYSGWAASAHDVTLRIQGADGAVVLPEPSGAALSACALLLLLRRGKVV